MIGFKKRGNKYGNYQTTKTPKNKRYEVKAH